MVLYPNDYQGDMEWEAPNHEFKQVSDNVYYLSHSTHDRPLIGVILGKEATLLIDAGNSTHHSHELIGHLEKLHKTKGIAPIRYVVLTHWHWDHSFGHIGYRNASENKLIEDPLLIGHHHTTRKLKQQKSYEFTVEALQHRVESGEETEFIRTHILQEYPDPTKITVLTPKLSYEQHIGIDLGGIVVDIYHVGGDHAEDSSLIYLSDMKKSQIQKILFLGDCLYPDPYNNWRYTSDNIDHLVSQIKKYPADIYLDAHDLPWKPEEFTVFLEDFVLISKYFSKIEATTEITDLNDTEIYLELLELHYRDGIDIKGESWKNMHLSMIRSFIAGLPTVDNIT